MGGLRVSAIDQGAIQRFKAELAVKKGRNGKPLSPKARNNILGVLSKSLRYAEEAGVIERAPRIRLYRNERPEIVHWEIDEYAGIVGAALDDPAWRLAVLLGGEAGLRLGEILALRWTDVDFQGGVVTVARQVRRGVEGTPKGYRRRDIPMTPLLAK